MSSYCQKATLGGGQGNFQLLPETDMIASNNNEFSGSDTSISEGGEQENQRRSTRKKRQSQYLKDYEVQINNCSVVSCFFTGEIDEEEPGSYEEAKHQPEWEAAMQEEIEALNKNQTWELVPKPENCEPITYKWVYRLKRKSDGIVDKCKARLVAHGFSQSYGLD